MFPLSTPEKPALPFAHLPESARQAARDCLERRGFVPSAILEEYSYSCQDGYVKINALAFADKVRRTPAEYAGVTIYNAVNDVRDETLIPTLAQTAAPFHLIHRGDHFAFWASTVNAHQVEPVRLVADITYDQLERIFQEYSSDLSPSRIVGVKQGHDQFTHPFLRQLAPLQLALWAVDITRDLLINHFSDAIAMLREHSHDITSESTIINLAIQVLGAIVLADTGVLGDTIRCQEMDLPLSQLFQAA